MAIIKFINNKVGLKRTLNYICKEEKTNNKFISGKDCMAENAYEEMIAIKNMYGKKIIIIYIQETYIVILKIIKKLKLTMQ